MKSHTHTSIIGGFANSEPSPPTAVILSIPFHSGPYAALRPIESRMDHLKPNSCWLHDVDETNIHILVDPIALANTAAMPSETHTMYSSVLSSQQQNSRLPQINTPGYSAHPGQFSVRLFKTPTLSSYYAAPKYDTGYRTAALSNYYSASRYDDPPSRFPSAPDPQRSSQYPTSARTSNLTARDYNPRPSNINTNYNFTRGNTESTYIYEQSDTLSVTEYDDDTATNDSYSPITPTSPAMSTDSLLALKSPVTEDDCTGSMRRNSIAIPVPPLPLGSTTSRSYPPDHEGLLRSGDEIHFRSNPGSTASITTPISVPPSTSTSSDTRPLVLSATNVNGPGGTAPPVSSSSGGYTWHHALPSIAPSEADTEDVSLEARMNAEYNAIATGSLYKPSTTDGPDTKRSNLIGPIPAPVPSARGRSSPPGGLHVTVPVTTAEPTQGVSSSMREPQGVAKSPASSSIFESLEEGRGTGYLNHRDSIVAVGDRDQFLPPFADDRWVNDKKPERERRGSISYQRVPLPPPVPELRREYTGSTAPRAVVSSASATYGSSPPRSSTEDHRLAAFPPSSTTNSRPRRDSRAGFTAPPPTRSSPPRQEEAKLDTSPRRRTESALGLHIPDAVAPARGVSAYPPPSTTRSEVPTSSHAPDPYVSRATENYIFSGSSSTGRRASPPTVPSGNLNHSQSTVPLDAYRPSGSTYRSQTGSAPTDTYRTQNVPTSTNPYRPQSTAPTSNAHRTPNSSDPYRAQSTVPLPEAPHRSQGPVSTSEIPYRSGYPPQMAAPAPLSSSHSVSPSTRVRTNSGSWSRNATVSSNSAPPSSSKTPSPSSKHAQASIPRSGSRSNSPSTEPLPPSRTPSDNRHDQARSSPPSRNATATAIAPVIGQSQGQLRYPSPPNTPAITPTPPKIARSSSRSPPRDALTTPRDTAGVRSPPKQQRGMNGDSDHSVEQPTAKVKLTIRNPSPSETSTERSENSPRAQQPPVNGMVPLRRSTLPYDARTGTNGQTNMNDYGRHLTHVPEQPQRRLSDGDRMDGPSFSFNTTGRGQLARCVRWNENLVCPSPVFPNRRRGWFNRRGDQLWTNEGAYKPPPSGEEYPPDLDDYPEYGQGWMNEEGVRIDMAHRLVPKAPRRSALKQPKPLS